MEFSSLSQSAQEEPDAENQFVYVEELTGPDDYWLSITDAARICRVQDVSIRRAITRKVLPVRRQRAGQNKRTRFVRATDLAKAGFPIIDESAAITTDIGKVDILSIPRQQQHILREHQQLTTQLGKMQETLTDYQVEVQAEFQRQREQSLLNLQAMQKEQALQFQAVEARLVQAQEQLRQVLGETEQRFAAEKQQLRTDLAQAQANTLEREARLQEMLQSTQAELQVSQQETRHAFEDLVATQQKLLRDHQQTVNSALQYAAQETRKQFMALEQRIAGDLEKHVQKVDGQFVELAEQLTRLRQSAEDWYQSATIQKREIDSVLQQQQARLDQHTQLLPLLPYAQQRLVTEPAMAEALMELETRLLAAQIHKQARYQPLLNLLTPERLEILAGLLAELSAPPAKEPL